MITTVVVLSEKYQQVQDLMMAKLFGCMPHGDSGSIALSVCKTFKSSTFPPVFSLTLINPIRQKKPLKSSKSKLLDKLASNCYQLTHSVNCYHCCASLIFPLTSLSGKNLNMSGTLGYD